VVAADVVGAAVVVDAIVVVVVVDDDEVVTTVVDVDDVVELPNDATVPVGRGVIGTVVDGVAAGPVLEHDASEPATASTPIAPTTSAPAARRRRWRGCTQFTCRG
jgi:flagellar biosynthesis/type III secretory pathway ATPase